MRILLLSRYERMGQSSRLRTLQYIPYLKDHGVRTETASLFDDSYLAALNAGKARNPVTILHAYLNRLRLAPVLRRYDIIWLEKELFPWIPFVFEKRLLNGAPPIVMDIDDADFHHYDLSGNPMIRILMSSKIAGLMNLSALVTAGNDYLASYARRSGARAVEELPTVVDLARYPITGRTSGAEGTVTIGWIGAPTTAPYLNTIAPALRDIAHENSVRLVLVGSGDMAIDGVKPEIYPWTEASEVEMVSSFDIGIMPLAKTPWELGKCGYKIIQYMACSKPVVASAFGANLSIIKNGQEGFLADGIEDWIRALRQLIRDPGLRLRMGASGRRLVEQRYCTGITAPRLLNLFRNIHSSN